MLRRPIVWGGSAAALLVALAIPALSLHTVDSGAQGLPRDLPVMKVYERVAEGVPRRRRARRSSSSARTT